LTCHLAVPRAASKDSHWVATKGLLSATRMAATMHTINSNQMSNNCSTTTSYPLHLLPAAHSTRRPPPSTAGRRPDCRLSACGLYDRGARPPLPQDSSPKSSVRTGPDSDRHPEGRCSAPWEPATRSASAVCPSVRVSQEGHVPHEGVVPRGLSQRAVLNNS
jgi:hypothetical protein